MISANYISNDEFALMNPELDLSGYNATTISGMISRASATMDNFLQYSLGVEDITGETTESIVSSNGNLLIYTRKFPIVTVSAIQLKLGTVHLDLTMTDGSGNPRWDVPSRGRSILYPYQEISMTGVFSVRNFSQMRGREIYTKISYRAGYDVIPGELKDACNLITKDIFVRQANPQNAASVTQGGISTSFRLPGDSGMSVYMQQAQAIMSSYLRVVS